MRETLSETLTAGLRQADAEARSLNQEFVGTEHLVLGILAQGDSHAARALAASGDAKSLRESLLKSLPKGSEPPLVTGRLPLSPKAQRMINTAIAGAQAAGESAVSSRFILLALLQERESAVVQALARSGAEMEQLGRLLAERPAEPEK